MRRWLLLPLLLCLGSISGCGDDDSSDAGDAAADANLDGDTGDVGADAEEIRVEVPDPAVIGSVEETRQSPIEGLSAPAFIVYTEHGVPHVYAESRTDAARALGLVMGRDRFFFMDMARRLAEGTLSEVLGEPAVSSDLESRGMGMKTVAERSLARVTDEQGELFDAFVSGVNAYIAEVERGDSPAPSVYQTAGPLFGLQPVELLEPFDRADVLAIAASITYQLGFETGDVRRESAALAIEARPDDEPLDALRKEALWDVYGSVLNATGYTSASGWSLEERDLGMPRELRAPPLPFSPDLRPRLPVNLTSLGRLAARSERFQKRLGRTHDEGFGSNAWAAAGGWTADGSAVLAADGHLPATVPTLFYRMGLDTKLLGDGDTRQVGLALPGIPMLAVGTNGDVAWNQTQFFGDITDWYREELELDDEGRPVSAMAPSGSQALVRIDETFDIADRALLMSEGRSVTFARFVTADGRLIAEIEGEELSLEEAEAAEVVVAAGGALITPGDMDGDGVITAISFDYTGLDGPNFALTLEAFGHATTVDEMLASSDSLVAYSQNIVAADSSGAALYTPYQVMPCRSYLRDAEGGWAAGGDPGRLIDATRFGSFELPLTEEGRVIEGEDGARCVVPRDEYIGAVARENGSVVSANNDPGTMARDNDLTNDPHYVGGPWHEDFRAARIAERLGEEAGSIDESFMQALQGDARSPLGAALVPALLNAIANARAADIGAGGSEARLAALSNAIGGDLAELQLRLRVWGDAGYPTPTGVETFYDPLDESDIEHSVATMVFNAWVGKFVQLVFGDEDFPGGIYTPTGSGGTARTILRLVAGRGEGNTDGIAGLNPETDESIFFDDKDTPEVETSDELMLLAVAEALAFLRSEPTGPGQGGFGSDNWDDWRWGLRHHLRLDSLLADFLGDDDSFSFILDQFAIDPSKLPLMEELAEGDVRASLPGFPRHGDNFCVDAANPGFSGERFTFGSIGVFRMVVALRGDETTGMNMLPGGQSGLTSSEHYSDQAERWLANEASPMRLSPEQVVEGAVSRETLYPPELALR